MEQMLRVGAITSTHGLKGEVKVFPTTDDPRRFDVLKQVSVQTKDGMELLKIERVKYFKQFVIVKFRGIDRIEDVEKYIKKELFVDREDAVPLAENEYFVADLIGLTVVDDQGRELGILDDVMTTGANDVYVVKKQKGELLIPAIRECILDVDVEGGKMTVHLLEGLE